jgi:ketosteroid isomerase-like protein
MAKGIGAEDRSAWDQRGGIRYDAKGRAVYVIRKQVNGRLTCGALRT